LTRSETISGDCLGISKEACGSLSRLDLAKLKGPERTVQAKIPPATLNRDITTMSKTRKKERCFTNSA